MYERIVCLKSDRIRYMDGWNRQTLDVHTVSDCLTLNHPYLFPHSFLRIIITAQRSLHSGCEPIKQPCSTNNEYLVRF